MPLRIRYSAWRLSRFAAVAGFNCNPCRDADPHGQRLSRYKSEQKENDPPGGGISANLFIAMVT